MKSMLTIMGLSAILLTTTFANAAENKTTASCKLSYRIVDAQGEVVPGSRVEGPSIEKLTYGEQNIEFKGFVFSASVSVVCNTSESQSVDDCPFNSLGATISRNGIKSEMSVDLSGLRLEQEMAQAVVLTTEKNEKVVAVCKVKKQ